MSIKTTLIASTMLVALLSVPAAAHIEGDEGGSTAYPTRRPAQQYVPPSYDRGQTLAPRRRR